MADLRIKDGDGSPQYLKATISGSGVSAAYIPHHIIQGVSGSVVVTSSVNAPVVVSSSGGMFSVSASLSNPVGITGSVTINNPVTTVTASVSNPVAIRILGTSSFLANVDSNNRLIITGAVNVVSIPDITASLSNPVGITGSVTVNNPIITASLSNPVGITGSTTSTIANIITVTSSHETPIYTLEAPASSINVIISSSFSYAAASGTFKLCAPDSSRKELFIHNPGPANLYVCMSTVDKTSADNFGFTWSVAGSSVTGNIPNNHSFIVYPSGTFISTEASRTLYYGGFFVSQSLNPTSSLISITTMN